MLVFFDNFCPICQRTAFIIRKLDWLNLIELKPLRDYLGKNHYLDMDKALALSQMASFTGKWHYGFASVYEITKRLPLFWLALTLFWLLEITGLGQFLYVQLSVKRKIIPIQCHNECEFTKTARE